MARTLMNEQYSQSDSIFSRTLQVQEDINIIQVLRTGKFKLVI